MNAEQLNEIEMRARVACGLDDSPIDASTFRIAREDVPALLAEARRLYSELVNVVAAWETQRNRADTAEADRDRARAEVEQLREDSAELRALEAAGVDNWDGYSYAMERLHEGEAS